MKIKKVLLSLALASVIAGCGDVNDNGIRDQPFVNIEVPKDFDVDKFMEQSGIKKSVDNDTTEFIAYILSLYTDSGSFLDWVSYHEFYTKVNEWSPSVIGNICKSISFYNSDDNTVILRVDFLNGSYQDFKLSAEFSPEDVSTDAIFKNGILQNPDTVTVPSAVDWSVVSSGNASRYDLSEMTNSYLDRLLYIHESSVSGENISLRRFSKNFEKWKKQTRNFSNYGVSFVTTSCNNLSGKWKCTLRFPDEKVTINIRDSKISVDIDYNI